MYLQFVRSAEMEDGVTYGGFTVNNEGGLMSSTFYLILLHSITIAQGEYS